MEADNRARNAGSRTPWRTFDGSIAVSFSMLLAVLLKLWKGAASWPLVGQLHQMTQWEDGVIIVATLLLFPTALALYGGFTMFFAAKEAVEKRAMERGRRGSAGRQGGGARAHQQNAGAVWRAAYPGADQSFVRRTRQVLTAISRHPVSIAPVGRWCRRHPSRRDFNLGHGFNLFDPFPADDPRRQPGRPRPVSRRPGFAIRDLL